MNANVIKSKSSFYTSVELKRTPANEDNKRICKYIDDHEFSFQIDKESNELKCMIIHKKMN